MPPGVIQGQPPQPHPALQPQQPPAVPPPPPLQNTTPPPLPPDNPQTDEDRQKAARYEHWLSQQEQDINTQLQYYEKEIAKLRKQKKVSQTAKLTFPSLINKSKVFFICGHFSHRVFIPPTTSQAFLCEKSTVS